MKSLKHALHALLVLSLLTASPLPQADPRPATPSHSFKGGFSSQRAAPPPKAPSQNAARGGFGSFGSAPGRSAQQSDSALSQRLDKNAAQANALRTLDARRAARDQAERDTRPVPGVDYRQNTQQQQPQQQPQQQRQPSGSGLGGVVTGMVLGQIASGAHARNNGYPGQMNGGTSSATVNQAPAATSFFGGVLNMFVWLMVLSAIGWLVYFIIQRKRRKNAETTPHYTFEGQ